MNGLSFDFHVCAHDRISEKYREILTEWDNKRKLPRYTSFRDKLVQYPKIVGGFSIPPLTEANCRPLKYLIEKSKTFRDAIVHPSPFLEPEAVVPEKDKAFYSVTSDDAFKTLDAVLDLIEAIMRALNRPIEELWWSHRQNSEGRFPDDVFR